MLSLLSATAGVLLASCVFDASGLDPVDAAAGGLEAGVISEASTDAAPSDAAPSDAAPSDAAPSDAAPPDTLALDQAPQPDQGGAAKPLSAAALGQAFAVAKVPCVTHTGISTSAQVPIVDSAKLTYLSAAVALTGAGSDTLSWVGGQPSITILYDPNTCGAEEKPGDSNWDSAGLLIRGATLNPAGALLLAPKTTVKDINLVNVESSGAWQDDIAKPDDSDLKSYPQLVKPVDAAKQIIVKLGLP